MDVSQRTSKVSKTRRTRRGSRPGGKLPSNITTLGQFRSPLSVSFPPSVIGFPDRIRTVLKYSDLYSFGASTSPSAQVFRLNSCFDPDLTGAGHQPSFFDVYTSVYQKYCVIAAKMELECTNDATTGVHGVAVYSDVDLSSNTAIALAESKNGISFLLGSGSGLNTKKISLPWMTTAKIMGQKEIEPDNFMYASVGSNPTDIFFGYFKFVSDDGATNVNVHARATLYQEVVFKDMNTLYSS